MPCLVWIANGGCGGRYGAPVYGATKTVAAKDTPNALPVNKNRTALEVAVSAALPKNYPTQTAWTDAFKGCRTLLLKIGNVKTSSVRMIESSVRLLVGFIIIKCRIR